MSAMEDKRADLWGMLGDIDGVSPVIAAAHELKSPLALVRQMALRLGGDISDAERRKLISQITLTSEKALRLTGDLTKVARLEDAMFEMEPINPEQICRDIVSEMTPLFKAHQLEISLDNRKHPLLLVANRDLLRRIIMNFSDNALHYSQPGTAVSLQIQELKNSGMVRIGVRDFGPALSSDMWKTLSSKLNTSAQPVHSRPQSSGLGLFIAGQFADIMNGKIGATRHRDGATFYVDLQASRQMSLL